MSSIIYICNRAGSYPSFVLIVFTSGQPVLHMESALTLEVKLGLPLAMLIPGG